MKKTKKLALGLGALLMSLTAASGVTGTLAWFTAANTVSVTGLNMQAAAEEGIVIANSDKGLVDDKRVWTTTAKAKVSGAGTAFIPTSTADFTNWYHGLVESAADGQTNEDIKEVTVKHFESENLVDGQAEGVNYGSNTQLTTAKSIFLLNKFYIQSAGAYKIENQDIYLKDLNVTGSTKSPELNKALRLGVLHDSTRTIFAPFDGATTSYKVNGATDNTSATLGSATLNTDTNIVAPNVNIPEYTADGANSLEFSVYLWFEGEDKACKSANITSDLDQLGISFKFGNKQKSH